MEKSPGVLIVDDEPANLLALKHILQKNGFTPYTAESGPEARSIAREKKPDIILLDVMMPEESGFDTIVALKEEAATADIPVIFITCLDDISNKLAGLNLGAVDYITKPFHSNEVLARIMNHLNMRRVDKAIIQEQAGRLNQVKKAQESILVNPDEIPEAQFESYFVPVLEAGGDFYDIFTLSGSKTGYFVADVSGHDLGASFITSSLKALLRQQAGLSQDPAEVLKGMNNVLGTIMREGQYFTAVFAVLDRDTMNLEVALAAHPPPIIMPAEGPLRVLDAKGDILGVFDEIEVGTFSVEVNAGDRVLLYTDGLLERYALRRPSRKEAMQDIVDACENARSLPMTEALTTILDNSGLAIGAPLDDILLIGFTV